MRAVPILTLTAAMLGVAGCQRADVAPRAEPPRPVRTVVAEPRQVAIALTLPGEVRPRIETRYGFRVGGKLAQRAVSVGDRVVAGTVLARLDPADVTPAINAQQAQLVASRTDADLAAVELQRLRDLREKNYISQAQLDRQQATLDSAAARLDAAQAQLRQARNALEFQTLVANAPGVVTAVDAESGQVVAAGQSVIRVAQTGEREVAINIPESDVATARATEQWAVLIPALAGRTLQGRLREFTPVSDPASRTYPARLALSGDLAGVELGMTAVVQAVRPSASAFVLPLSALYSKDGQPRVWVVDPATQSVRSVPVQTAGLVDDAVRVVGGIRAGDRVVTAGANLLVPDQKVRVLDAPAAGGAR